MDLRLKEKFLVNWGRYFGVAELPLVFYFSDQPGTAALVVPPSQWRCFICDLAKARNGQDLCFNAASLGCPGGRRYLGFSRETMPDFEYFLSCGIPGKMEGERYKKSPELVRQWLSDSPAFQAPGPYLIVKRWDKLEAADTPEIVVFFATPDVLSGLFTLSNFDRADAHAVMAPFAAGCGTIVQYPYLEKGSDNPRAVLGMFDVSARPHVPAGTLSFAVPFSKFTRMIDDMAESFLITPSWKAVRKRIG